MKKFLSFFDKTFCLQIVSLLFFGGVGLWMGLFVAKMTGFHVLVPPLGMLGGSQFAKSVIFPYINKNQV